MHPPDTIHPDDAIALGLNQRDDWRERRHREYLEKSKDLIGPVDNSNWRTEQRVTDPFCDERKRIYLDQVESHGSHHKACAAAGVPARLVKLSLENDPDFADAVLTARGRRSDRIVLQLEEEALVGHWDEMYGKDGQIVARRRVLEAGLRSMMLKRHGAEYRNEGSETEETPGVIYAPAGIPLASWEEHVAQVKALSAPITGADIPAAAGKTIDAVGVTVKLP